MAIKTILRIQILLCLLLFYSNPSLAEKYFVSTASEISNRMQTAQPGDTLVMTDGVWANARIVFQGNGAEGNPIVLQAETPGYVVLNGTSTLRISGSYLVVDGLRFVKGESTSGGVIEFRTGSAQFAHHSRLTNCSIVDYNPESKSKDYKWVSIYGSHNRVDHCFFEGKTHSGTTLVVWLDGNPNYHLIDNNYFGERPPLGDNGGETIRIGTSDWSMSDSYTTVENNYFEHCDGEVEIISNKSGNNIYRYNTFYECEGALTMRHGNKCTAEGNFFIGNRNFAAGGVRIIGEDHKVINNYFYGLYGSSLKSALPIMNGVPNSPLNRYFQVKNALVAFNTFVDCRYSIILGAGSDSEKTLPPENCVIANNVVVSDRQIITKLDDPINLVWEGNLMQGSSLGIPQPEGITLIDPQLALAEDELWRPQEASPVINAAVGDYAFVLDDMDGQPRDSTKDVGADEFSQDSVLRRPLTAADVGPEWKKSIVPFVLSITTVGSGQVITDPESRVVNPNTSVTLTAIPNSGWEFVEWQGDIVSSDSIASIVMDDNKSVTAVFVDTRPPTYELTVSVFPPNGRVELFPPGGTYLEGSIVRVTAIPDSGWQFVNWGGSLTGTANPDTVIMDEDKNISPLFTAITTSVTLHQVPGEYRLGQNYPNPFNAGTNIPFTLKYSGLTTIDIYNIFGNRIGTILNRHLPAGSHHVNWDASHLASGTFFYKITNGKFSTAKKMILLK